MCWEFSVVLLWVGGGRGSHWVLGFQEGAISTVLLGLKPKASCTLGETLPTELHRHLQ